VSASKVDVRKKCKSVETDSGIVMHTSSPIIITGDAYTIATPASKVDTRKKCKSVETDNGIVMHTSRGGSRLTERGGSK